MLACTPIANDPKCLSDKGEIGLNIFSVGPFSSTSLEFKIRLNATRPTSDIANGLFKLISVDLGRSTVSRDVCPQKLRGEFRAQVIVNNEK
jgi:hypothetical protein